MAETSPRQLALYAVALLAVVLLGARSLARDSGPPAAQGPAPRIEVGEDGGGRLVVHVAGAVRRPGVYQLRAGARVVDAVQRAGGARRAGDLSQLNLAAELEDGRQVLVPVRAPPAGAAAPAAGGSLAQPGAPVNVNTATVEELDALPGVGPATAAAIVEYREASGGFGSVEELDEVPGIGEGRLADLRERVTL